MKNILYLILFFHFFACSKVSVDQSIEKSFQPPTYLDFEINSINYADHEEQDSFEIQSVQDTSLAWEFFDFHNLKKPFMYMYAGTSSEDSLLLHAILRFKQMGQSDFGAEFFDLNFTYVEDKGNLIKQTDTSYTYQNNLAFYDKLISSNWGNKNLFMASDISQMYFSLPFFQDEPNGYHAHNLSSNGFYFEHEQLSLTNILYIEEKDEIHIEGNFDVDLKFLSCGFYSLYNVRNAKFFAIIK